MLHEKAAEGQSFRGAAPGGDGHAGPFPQGGPCLHRGLQMVGQEFPDPVGTSSARPLTRSTSGWAYEECSSRTCRPAIDSDDLKLFVISVIIQRNQRRQPGLRSLKTSASGSGTLHKLKRSYQDTVREGVCRPIFVTGLRFSSVSDLFPKPFLYKLVFTDPIGHVMLVFRRRHVVSRHHCHEKDGLYPRC